MVLNYFYSITHLKLLNVLFIICNRTGYIYIITWKRK